MRSMDSFNKLTPEWLEERRKEMPQHADLFAEVERLTEFVREMMAASDMRELTQEERGKCIDASRRLLELSRHMEKLFFPS